VDQLGDLHEGVIRRIRVGEGIELCRSGINYGPSVTAPGGTEIEPVDPMAALEAEAVPAVLVGIP
jgi:hypothetical protein